MTHLPDLAARPEFMKYLDILNDGCDSYVYENDIDIFDSHAHDRHTTRNHNGSSTGEQREVPFIQLDSDNESITSGGSAVPSPAIPQNFDFPTSSLPKDNELTVLSVKQLNTRLKGLPRNVVNDIKKRRRTLKNRGYAHSCRLKRISEKNSLEKNNEKNELYIDELKRENAALRKENHFLKVQLQKNFMITNDL